MGAIGGKKDKLKQFDAGGGGGFFNFWGNGGGGGGDDDGGRGTMQVLFLVFCFLFVFYGLKPLTAIIVNAIYYVFNIPTGRPGDEDPEDLRREREARQITADAAVIAKYGADDDDDDDDDDE